MTIDKDDKKSGDFRVLNISNFRNLAPFAIKDDDEDRREFLKINRSLKRDEIGGLVILIGGNNCGKSNVLRALQKYDSGDITEEDYTDFTVARLTPFLEMNVSNGKYENKDQGPKLISGCLLDYLKAAIFEKESYESYIDKYDDNATLEEYQRWAIAEFKKLENSDASDEDMGMVITILKNRKDCKRSSLLMDNIKKFESGGIGSLKSIILTVRRPGTPIRGAYDDDMTFEEKFGYVLSNNVYDYQREKITRSDLRCSPDNLSPFMKKVLKIIGYDEKTITNTIYECDNKDPNHIPSPILRKRSEHKIDKELKKVAERFNKLFKNQEKQYSMSISLEEERIIFYIQTGDDVVLNIDRQSEGFKWIFEFFINQIASTDFKPGDIVTIDEFGNALNFGTIADLGNELRSFAKENGITFVLATQNPMVIDTNFLDEVRLIVPHDNGSSSIINDFNQFSTDHDLMKPILNGMTVGRNYMRSDKRRTIFVEGVTDYFYLSAFARQMRSDDAKLDLDFLPINGLGAKMDDPADLMKTLISIERYNPVIFTDSDLAGISISEAAKEFGVTQIQIADVFPKSKKTDIEDLFSQNDRERLEVDDKSFDKSACFAHKIFDIYPTLDQETKDNFIAVLNYLNDATP